MLLMSLSLKLLAVLGGTQITSGVLPKGRSTVVLSRPAVCVSLVTKPLSLPVHTGAAEMLRRERLEQPDPVNRLVDVDKYLMVVSLELDPANKKQLKFEQRFGHVPLPPAPNTLTYPHTQLDLEP